MRRRPIAEGNRRTAHSRRVSDGAQAFGVCPRPYGSTTGAVGGALPHAIHEALPGSVGNRMEFGVEHCRPDVLDWDPKLQGDALPRDDAEFRRGEDLRKHSRSLVGDHAVRFAAPKPSLRQGRARRPVDPVGDGRVSLTTGSSPACAESDAFGLDGRLRWQGEVSLGEAERIRELGKGIRWSAHRFVCAYRPISQSQPAGEFCLIPAATHAGELDASRVEPIVKRYRSQCLLRRCLLGCCPKR